LIQYQLLRWVTALEFQKAFGNTLRRLRLAKGLTQEAFYDIVSESYVSKLENGHKTPSWSLIVEIAKVLQVEPLVLITIAVAEQRDVEAVALAEQVAQDIKSADRENPPA
jgi:transcriptional regulator with XRE-family HTH domain